MITIKVNQQQEYSFDYKQQLVLLNGNPAPSDWVSIGKNKYHVIVNHQSYTIELLGVDETGKQYTMMVNGQKHVVAIKDQFDSLLQQLGMDKLVSAKVNQVKAPMPGLVLRILVDEGQTIKKGDPLLVLEAMKMENIIKSAGDGIVKSVMVQPKVVVDKGQVMLVME